ncbi:uncharacterized protein LOC124134670 isoform X2 [Haliotis rufescens]|uniref:uncharacterized protein LOC124134670 isoform X2 n=1 Tax=Haliotis rufescens TaxID=6454 RepID=UPI00201EC7DB|nr:uncharacterized protein LOC124134670 isoform X2 [Haliotis rufescens]
MFSRFGSGEPVKKSTNLWDDGDDTPSQFSRTGMYSRSKFQYGSSGRGQLDKTSQQTGGNLWDDADENPPQFSRGSKTVSDRTDRYRGYSKFSFQESQTAPTSDTWGGLGSSFRNESLDKGPGKDYFGAQSRNLDMETESRGRGRGWTTGQKMETDRLPHAGIDTGSNRFGMESRGLETGRRFLGSSNTSYPMETESMRFDEGGKNWTNFANPTNLRKEPESDIFSDRHRGSSSQPRNETRNQWSHESPRSHSAGARWERESYRFSETPRGPSAGQEIARRRDNSVLDTGVMQELKMRMAAERQQSRVNPVDMNKVMKVMNIVDQLSDEPRQNVSPRRNPRTRDFYGKVETAHPRESRGLKRDGSMHGTKDREDRSLKRGRREDFGDRERPRSFQRSETFRDQQKSSIHTKEKPVSLLDLKFDFPKQGVQETMGLKLRRLVANIKSFKASGDHVNDIHTLDISLAKCKIRSDYKQEVLGKVGKKLTFTGCLMVNGIFLARCLGTGKKEVKHACYEEAINVLMTKPVEEIMEMKDEGSDNMMKKLLAVEEKKKSTKEVVPGAPNLQLCEKLEKLIKYLNGFKKRADTPIIELNNANVAASNVFHREYREDSMELVKSTSLGKGHLTLDGHLIATAVGKVSKRVKYRTYAKGIDLLKNSPMSVVLEGVLADDNYSNLSAHDVLSPRHVGLPDEETQQKLGKLIGQVKRMANSNQAANNILQIASKNANLLLTCLSKRGAKGGELFTECDLYVDCIYICTGEGYKYTDAVKQTYEEAIRVLSNSSPDVIFNDFKRITTQDVHNVTEVCEVWEGKKMKTFFWSNYHKIQTFKKRILFKQNPDYTEFPRDWERMIIMEQEKFSSDRVNKAYEILLNSATRNFVTLHGKGSTEGNVLKCELFLQGEKLAEANGKNNVEASAKAAAKILFKFYEQQPTIKLLADGDDSKSWHTYESIKEKADQMKAESEDSETDDFIYINDFPPRRKQKVQEEAMEVDQQDADKDADKDAPSSSHSVTEVKHPDTMDEGDCLVGDSDAPSSTLPVNKWVKQVVEKMIVEFAATESLEEVIFGPGFPVGDQRQIKISAAKHRVYSCIRATPDKSTYVCLFQKLSPEMTLRTLKWKGKCGKYAIMPKEELPKLDDLEKDSFGIHTSLQRSHWKGYQAYKLKKPQEEEDADMS